MASHKNESRLLTLKKIKPSWGGKSFTEPEKDKLPTLGIGVPHAKKSWLCPDQIAVTCSFPVFAVTNISVPISYLLIGFISSSLPVKIGAIFQGLA